MSDSDSIYTSVNDTPETNSRTTVPTVGAATVPASFARKLEREVNKWKNKALALSEKLAITENEIHQLKKDNNI
jgi:hypothetical protein